MGLETVIALTPKVLGKLEGIGHPTGSQSKYTEYKYQKLPKNSTQMSSSLPMLSSSSSSFNLYDITQL